MQIALTIDKSHEQTSDDCDYSGNHCDGVDTIVQVSASHSSVAESAVCPVSRNRRITAPRLLMSLQEQAETRVGDVVCTHR